MGFRSSRLRLANCYRLQYNGGVGEASAVPLPSEVRQVKKELRKQALAGAASSEVRLFLVMNIDRREVALLVVV